MVSVRVAIVAVLAGACGFTVPASGAAVLCEEIAADAGLDFHNPYGPVAAAEEVGRVMQRNMGNGAAVGDYDADGDLDVYLLSNAGSPAGLYQNRLAETGRAIYADVTADAGVTDHGLGRTAHFADLDGDADVDLLVVNDTAPGVESLTPSRIFRNDGDGTFTDVTNGSGFAPAGYLVGGTTLADFDQDGDLDIYVSYWTRELNRSPVGAPIEGAWPGSNRYYENLGDLRFADTTEQVGLAGMTMDSFTAVPHDFDVDGDLDLYVAVDHRSDRYYRNDGGTFVDMTGPARAGHRGNDMGVAAGDVDGDGTVDLFVSNVFDPQQSYGVDPPGNTLLLASLEGEAGVVFRDEAEERGVLDTGWSWGAAFVDFDLDQDLDLYVVQGFDEFIADDFVLDGARSSLLLNDGDARFAADDRSGCDLPGDQRALIPFDHDRDGDPDLLVTQVDGPPLLIENRSSGATLTVAIDPSHGSAAGAIVEATTDDGSMSRLVLAGGSYLAGPPLEAYFGLGAHDHADVTVTWADGHQQTYSDVAAGSMLVVERRGP